MTNSDKHSKTRFDFGQGSPGKPSDGTSSSRETPPNLSENFLLDGAISDTVLRRSADANELRHSSLARYNSEDQRLPPIPPSPRGSDRV